MSRPSSSVPSQCAAVGPCKASRLERAGSYGATAGARSAQAATSRTIASPIRAAALIIARLSKPDLRVDEAVEEIGDQVHDHDSKHHQHADGEHHRKIAAGNGADKKSSHSRHREYCLRDHGAADQLSHGKSGKGDHRKHRIWKYVPECDACL